MEELKSIHVFVGEGYVNALAMDLVSSCICLKIKGAPVLNQWCACRLKFSVSSTDFAIVYVGKSTVRWHHHPSQILPAVTPEFNTSSEILHLIFLTPEMVIFLNF